MKLELKASTSNLNSRSKSMLDNYRPGDTQEYSLFSLPPTDNVPHRIVLYGTHFPIRFTIYTRVPASVIKGQRYG